MHQNASLGLSQYGVEAIPCQLNESIKPFLLEGAQRNVWHSVTTLP
jgi:hypothetical protein